MVVLPAPPHALQDPLIRHGPCRHSLGQLEESKRQEDRRRTFWIIHYGRLPTFCNIHILYSFTTFLSCFSIFFLLTNKGILNWIQSEFNWIQSERATGAWCNTSQSQKNMGREGGREGGREQRARVVYSQNRSTIRFSLLSLSLFKSDRQQLQVKNNNERTEK